MNKKELIILRSDLTNKVGYESKEWHLKAPFIELDAAKWIADSGFKSVCLDFPKTILQEKCLIGLFIIKNLKSIILYLIVDVPLSKI